MRNLVEQKVLEKPNKKFDLESVKSWVLFEFVRKKKGCLSWDLVRKQKKKTKQKKRKRKKGR